MNYFKQGLWLALGWYVGKDIYEFISEKVKETFGNKERKTEQCECNM